MLKPSDHVYAVVNNNSEDFAWMRNDHDRVEDQLMIVAADAAHIGDMKSDDANTTGVILDGGCWGVFEAPACDIFRTEKEAAKSIRVRNRERAHELVQKTTTVAGLLQFLVEHNALQIPADPIAREVLYTQMEDAGLGDMIPMYALENM
jgi:hypothetical protein